MNVNAKELILDMCLEEVLGGQSPPDMVSRIMQAWRVETNGRIKDDGIAGHSAAPTLVAGVSQDNASVQPATSKATGKSNWVSVVVAASILVVCTTIGIIAWRSSIVPIDDPGEFVEKGEDGKDKEDPVGPGIKARRSQKPPIFKPAYRLDRPEASLGRAVIDFIDDEIKARWGDHQIAPSKPATDGQWCDRVFRKLVGRTPSAGEIEKFVDNTSADKKTNLVNDLMGSDEYVQHWATVWTNVLIGRADDNNESVSRQGLRSYLEQSIAEDKPFDQLAFELLTAVGSGNPQAEDFNGAANFMLAGIGHDATRATIQTSRVFLSNNLQCSQCHDHLTGERQRVRSWQAHFWELNSFFRQMAVEQDGDTSWLVNQDFVSRRMDLEGAAVVYKLRDGSTQSAYPVLPDGESVSKSGRLSEIDRRLELAKWIVRSDKLSRSVVNRMWSHFFGFGFTEQVDSIGPHDPPSHPVLLEGLANQLIANDYRLKSLTRWLVLSEAFGLSSDLPADSLVDIPEIGGQALFSRYYVQPVKPEAVKESLLTLSKASTPEDLEQAKKSWIHRIYGQRQGDPEVDPFRLIEEVFVKPHGRLAKKFVREQRASLIRQLADSKMSSKEKISHLFLSVLSRKPSKSELELAGEIYATNKDDTSATLEIIWWALSNSSEVILAH